MSTFKVIVCGCTGGPKENNLSCYLLSPAEKNETIALDAGTLFSGLEAASLKGNLQGNVGRFFQEEIKAYLISHAHLDHVLGLIINSQADKSKLILGSDETLNAIRSHLFNWKIWPNFANEGEEHIGLYLYSHLVFNQERKIPHTDLMVEMFPLDHNRHQDSSAFLIRHQEAYFLYFGDTASDRLSGSRSLQNIWTKIAPLIVAKKLKGMILECSYVKGEKEGGSRYHLDTETFMEEMALLAETCGTLAGLPVVVSHRKERLQDATYFGRIQSELINTNRHGLKLLFPEQGDLLWF